MSRLTKGLAVTAIPIYVVGGFLIGKYLGEKAGNPTVGIILGLFAGLLLALYDIYLIVVPKTKDDDHGKY